MGRILLGRFMVAGACFFLLAWLVSLIQPGSHIALLVIAAVLGYFGWQRAKVKPEATALQPPPVPAGFTPSHWHQNIALDAQAGKLWLRDENGRTKTFSKREIVGWEITSKSFGPDVVVGPKTPFGTSVSAGQKAHFANRLLMKTTDLDQPVYAVKFDHHGAMLNAELNRRDVTEWSERLNAFVRS